MQAHTDLVQGDQALQRIVEMMAVRVGDETDAFRSQQLQSGTIRTPHARGSCQLPTPVCACRSFAVGGYSCAAGERSDSVERSNDVARLRLVLGVVVGVRRLLHRLCGDGEGQGRPVAHPAEAFVERGRGVYGVSDLLGCAPARRRTLLEKAEGVVV